MKFLKRNIALYLLLLSVLSFNSVEFFHNHDDGTAKDDGKCSACIFSSALSTVDIITPDITPVPIISYFDFQSIETTFPVFEVIGSPQSRAPPLFHA